MIYKIILIALTGFDLGTKPIKNKDTKKNGLVILLSDFSKRYKIWRTSEITKCNNSTNGI